MLLEAEVFCIDTLNTSLSNSSHGHAAPYILVSLYIKDTTYHVTYDGLDPEVRVRLIGIAGSGQTSIYTLEHKAPSSWTVVQPPVTVDGSARPVSGGSFVLDAKSGVRRPADRAGLAAILQKDEAIRGDSVPKNIWISAGAKGVRTALNVNGERIAKEEWGGKVGTVEHVEVVRRLGERMFV